MIKILVLPILVHLLIFFEVSNAQVGHRCNGVFPKHEKIQSFSKSYWKSYDRRFIEESTQYIQKRLDLYLQAKSVNHPQIEFLEDLGFKFSENLVVVPSMKKIFSILKSRSKFKVEGSQSDSNNIDLNSNDDTFPTSLQLILSNNLKSITIFRQWGESFDPEYEFEHPPKNSQSSTVLNDSLYFHLLHTGISPISYFGSLDGKSSADGISTQLHDLAHLGGLLQNRTYRSLIQKASARPNTKNLESFLALEAAFLINETTDAQFSNWLMLPESLVSSRNYIEIFKHYSKLSPSDYPKLQNQILSKLYQFVELLGGSNRDLISGFQFPSLDQLPTEMAIKQIEYMFKDPSISYFYQKEAYINFPRKDPVIAFSQFAHFVLVSRQIKTSDWADLLSKTKYNPKIFSEIQNEIKQIPDHPLKILEQLP